MTTSAATRVAGLLLLAVTLTACTGDSAVTSGDSRFGQSEGNGILAEAVARTTEGAGLVDPAEVLSGGVPVDGIPAVDDPVVVSAEEASESLVETEPVLLVTVAGESRAYPLRSLTRHEIVNDTLGGIPVAATWCPLCNTGLAFAREVEGTLYDFGVSGLLHRSAMVMYDRQTRSLWTQPTGTAVLGPLTGLELPRVDSEIVGWADALASDPGVTVGLGGRGELTAAANPYVGYDSSSDPFLFTGVVDPRLEANERVVGVAAGGVAQAWSYRHLAEVRVQAATVEGSPAVVLFEPTARSALDTGDIREGRAVGSSGVYRPQVDGQSLTLRAEGDRFTDAETASTWLVTGVAVAGPLAGQRLERVPSLDAFWFAWAAFNPGTGLVP